MTIDRTTTVAFTGHRTYDGRAAEMLCATIAALYHRGYRTFMSGMAVGFDLAAAEAVIACRAQLPGLHLLCAVPFEEQPRQFSAVDKQRYAALLATADAVEIVCAHYLSECYTLRNNFLIDNASTLIAYYDGSAGGTHYTFRRAQRQRLEIINLFIDPQQTLPGL
ncbi:MAG: SLOG family protein [Alistipes sp.]